MPKVTLEYNDGSTATWTFQDTSLQWEAGNALHRLFDLNDIEPVLTDRPDND